jgi:hypothetical protein
MTKQNRRQFLGLALGGLLAQAVKPIVPAAIEPWYVRCAKPDWTPSPTPGTGHLLALQGFLGRGEMR